MKDSSVATVWEFLKKPNERRPDLLTLSTDSRRRKYWQKSRKQRIKEKPMHSNVMEKLLNLIQTRITVYLKGSPDCLCIIKTLHKSLRKWFLGFEVSQGGPKHYQHDSVFLAEHRYQCRLHYHWTSLSPFTMWFGKKCWWRPYRCSFTFWTNC